MSKIDYNTELSGKEDTKAENIEESVQNISKRQKYVEISTIPLAFTSAVSKICSNQRRQIGISFSRKYP